MVNLNDGIHYNWEKTLSYNADITMVVGAPDKGKTYGLRAYALNAAIKRDERFVEVCRTLDERDSVKKGYFDKLAATDEIAAAEVLSNLAAGEALSEATAKHRS